MILTIKNNIRSIIRNQIDFVQQDNIDFKFLTELGSS